MRLSPHFTLRELTKSQVAARYGLDNTPDEAAIRALARLADGILEPVRAAFGRPFSPSSGYRSLALNRRLGAKDSSQHCKGEAVDFEIPGVANRDLACWIRDHLTFDQLILEFYTPGVPTSGWVHCSLKERGNRGEVLTITGAGVRRGIETGG